MRSRFRAVRLPLLVLALAGLSAPASHLAASSRPAHYVCPPCGNPCDGKVHDGPGTCPQCGMRLVAQDAAPSHVPATRKVAILVFDGVQIIDYTGPYEIFQAAGLEVYTVAATRAPITTVAGMTVVPRYAFAEAPPPDVLVVPGGNLGGPLGNAATLGWVQETAARAQHTLSVCNGAFILAKAGLLDGLVAATTAGNVARLRAEYPRLRVVEDQRWVDNGRIVTAGGLTAGVDGALHLVAKVLGQGTAQRVALAEEYDWHPAGGFARGALADMNLGPWLDAALDGTGTWEVASTEGDRDHWQLEGRGASPLPRAELAARLGKGLVREAHWTPAPPAAAGGSPGTVSRWTFTGRDHRPWSGTLEVAATSGEPGRYALKLTISRAG
jgi:putative intracellular protease/amidase